MRVAGVIFTPTFRNTSNVLKVKLQQLAFIWSRTRVFRVSVGRFLQLSYKGWRYADSNCGFLLMRQMFYPLDYIACYIINITEELKGNITIRTWTHPKTVGLCDSQYTLFPSIHLYGDKYNKINTNTLTNIYLITFIMESSGIEPKTTVCKTVVLPLTLRPLL